MNPDIALDRILEDYTGGILEIDDSAIARAAILRGLSVIKPFGRRGRIYSASGIEIHFNGREYTTDLAPYSFYSLSDDTISVEITRTSELYRFLTSTHDRWGYLDLRDFNGVIFNGEVQINSNPSLYRNFEDRTILWNFLW